MSRLRSFATSTASYERWREQRIPTQADDLAVKHAKLASSPFVLLRGTYYRFLEQFEGRLGDLGQAPATVAIGDLHIENFGTWRDHEGRLAWGVNDFDEVELLPYPLDLVRLAASAQLAVQAGHLAIDPREAAAAIHTGWRQRIEAGRAEPFVLGERHVHLSRLVAEAIEPAARFVRSMKALPEADAALPPRAARLVVETTGNGFSPQLRRRTAGVGSLGSLRIVALGDVDGGLVVREAKQIPGPATAWLHPERERVRGLAELIMRARGLAGDPDRRQTGKWVVRRLAPDATRLELADLRRKHDEAAVLHSMGAETANIHMVAHPLAASAKAIAADDELRPAGWLADAAATILTLTERDYSAWRAAQS